MKLIVLALLLLPAVMALNETNSTMPELNQTENITTPINVTLPENVTQPTNTTASENNCFIEISIKTEKEIYDEGEKIEFYNIINNTLGKLPRNFTIEYQITDINNKTIKSLKATKNLNKKSYTPKGREVIIIKNRLAYISCNNTNPIVSAEKIIAVKLAEKPKENSTSKPKVSATTPKAENTQERAINESIRKIPLKTGAETNINNNKQEEIIYESSDEKIKGYIPYFFGASIIVLMILIGKNGIQGQGNTGSRRIPRKAHRGSPEESAGDSEG